MGHEIFLLRLTKRRLAPALWLLAVAGMAAPAAAATPWQLEPIGTSEGVAGLHDLSFDEQGRGLLSWNGALQGRMPPEFGGLALRDPAGGWQRPPDLTGVEPESAQIHLFSQSRALLVARETATDDALGPTRRRLRVAEGQSDGGFGPLQTLDDFAVAHWSATNAAGEAIVAWTGERSLFVRVSVRSADGRYSRPRDLAVGASAAVAVGARGDRVLAWQEGRRLAARTRLAGGVEWGPTMRFGQRLASARTVRLSALISVGGRILLTWGEEGRGCGVAVRDGRLRWHVHRLERRCGPAAVGAREAPVLPFQDSRGATYVAWTGHTRTGRRAVKLARVGPGGPGRSLVLSRENGAVLDDAAGGPERALVVTWTAPRPTRAKPFITATFATLRREGGVFGASQRLTPATVTVARGSRVAFQPLTGEPVVAVPYLVGRTVAVGAAVGPPAQQQPATPP